MSKGAGVKSGWQTKTLADVCEIKPPKSEARERVTADTLVTFAPMENLGIDRKFLNATQVRPLASVVGSYTYFAEGDVLLAKITPCFENGKLGIAAGLRNGIGFGSSEFMVFRPQPHLDKEYLYYYLSRPDFRSEGAARMGGAVGQQRVQKEFIESYPIPLPPLPEQRRIVGILDEAFEGIATAKASAEKNLQNARALFESHLQSVFAQRGKKSADAQPEGQPQPRSLRQEGNATAVDDAEVTRLNAGYVTRTGGREATLRHIPGNLSLAVGMPHTGARKGWRWDALPNLARLESGHTPSRKHPEYWGGSVPWIGIQDARENHGQRISDTIQKTNELGIANSSARVLPENTVCLSRTASVGYVVVMGRPMATSQDFVNWVCSPTLVPDFLKYLFLAEGREGFLRYSSGAVHQTIYFPEAKAFHVCHPDTCEQNRIVRQCDGLAAETERLAGSYERKLAALEALRKSLLHQAFTGQLTADESRQLLAVTLTFPVKLPDITTTDAHAGILAIAFEHHEKGGKLESFTHVKAEKIAHMVEAHLGIDLGRSPVKDAAGPNDFPHLIKVEHRARMANYFDFKQVGTVYRVEKLPGFERLIEKTRAILADRCAQVEGLVKWMLPMKVQQAEIVATVYAAWNNLLLDGKSPTDEEIVYEARENWHSEKLRIARQRFLSAVEWLRGQGRIPQGRGKRVEAKGH